MKSLQAIPIRIPIFLCLPLFRCARRFCSRHLEQRYFGFAGHSSTRNLSPPPICRSCSAGLSLNSHLTSDSVRNSRRQKLVQLAAYSPEPVFPRVTRVATSIRSPPGRPAAQPAPIVIPAPARLGPPRFRELSGVPTVQDPRPWPGGSAPLPSSRLVC